MIISTTLGTITLMCSLTMLFYYCPLLCIKLLQLDLPKDLRITISLMCFLLMPTTWFLNSLLGLGLLTLTSR